MYYNKKRLVLSIFWVVLGAVLLLLSVFGWGNTDSAYAGLGGGLIAVGSLQIAKNRKYHKNAEYREKVDVELTDERNSYLRMKSWSWTGYVLVLGSGVGTLVAMVLGYPLLQQILAYVVCGIILLYWGIYAIVSKKY